MESKRKMLYVGGLDPSVDEATLHAAFIPFGNIKEVNIPKDFSTSKFDVYGVYWVIFMFLNSAPFRFSSRIWICRL